MDYFKFTNLFFIEKINCNKKVLITGDDVENHEMNSITASSCDIVLTHDPLSVLKFREKGLKPTKSILIMAKSQITLWLKKKLMFFTLEY